MTNHTIEKIKEDLQYWKNVVPTGMISGLSKQLKVKILTDKLKESMGTFKKDK